MGKFDFIRLSLSNPQSGQSLFLLHDSNYSYLSLRFIQGVSLVYPIKISHEDDRYLKRYSKMVLKESF